MAGKQSPSPVAAAHPQPSPSLLLQSCVTVQMDAGVVDFSDRTIVDVHKGDVDVDKKMRRISMGIGDNQQTKELFRDTWYTASWKSLNLNTCETVSLGLY